jgi:hypothetical protein
VARPVVPLLDLVQERRFKAKNKRHRQKLLEDDSLLEYVGWNEDAPLLWRELAELQERYRNAHRCLDRSHTSWAEGAFESSLRRLDDDGELLDG